MADPPHRSRRLLVWLLLLVCLGVACPALLVEIHQPDVLNSEEARTLATSIQSWRHRCAAEEGSVELFESMVPHLNDEKQLKRPPAVTWFHSAAFATMDWSRPSAADTAQLVLAARIASVVFSLLTLAAVYWAGHSLGGMTTAALSGLVCAANPLFIYYARLGTADIQHTGLTMFSIAAALWAIRPLRPAPSVERQFIGWVSSGLTLGGAILTGGPWTILYVTVPILIVLVLCPGRMSHLMGLLAALLIGILMVIPWAVYADQHDPEAHLHWLQSVIQSDWSDLGAFGKKATQLTQWLVVCMLPWTLWIVGAVVQPFSTSSSGSRLRLLLGWVWFASALLLVIASPLDLRLADQLIVLPAAAVLIGHLFNQYAALASEGRHAHLWRWLRWPHVAMLILASAALPALMHLQPTLIKIEWLSANVVANPPWYYGPGLGVALLGIIYLSLRWTVNQFPVRAMTCWAIWTLALMTVIGIPLARGPALNNPEVHRIAEITRDRSVYWFSAQGSVEPDPILVFYADRSVPSVTEAQIEQLAQEHDRFMLATRSTEPPMKNLTTAGRLPSLDLDLWKYTSAGEKEEGTDEESEQTGQESRKTAPLETLNDK